MRREKRELPRLLRGLVLQIVPQLGDDYTPDEKGAAVRADTDELDLANVVTSRERFTSWHRPVLDIDIRAELIPSSTPGHAHLYLDRAMPWDDYRKLLDVLAEVGIIEKGYRDASVERGYTAARLPWIKKEAPA